MGQPISNLSKSKTSPELIKKAMHKTKKLKKIFFSNQKNSLKQ